MVLQCKSHFWKSLIKAFSVYDKFAEIAKPFEWTEQNSDTQDASRGKTFVKMHDLVAPMTPIYYTYITILGIFQAVIGLLLLSVAIAFLEVENDDKVDYDHRYSLSGIAAFMCGALVLIAGILGFQSFKYPKSYCKSGINVAFCVLVCVVAFTCIGMYSAGIG